MNMIYNRLVISGHPVHRSLKKVLGVPKPRGAFGLDVIDSSDFLDLSDDELRTCLYWRAGIVAARDRGVKEIQ